MRTRTPWAAKSAYKSPVAGESDKPKSAETNRASDTKTRQAKKNEASLATNTASDSKLQQPSGEENKLADAEVATTTISVVKRTSRRTRTSTRAVSNPESVDEVGATADETPKVDNLENAEKVEWAQNVEVANIDSSTGCEKEEEHDVGFAVQSEENEQNPMEAEVPAVECEVPEKEIIIDEGQIPTSQDASISLKQEGPIALDLTESPEYEYSAKVGEKANEKLKGIEGDKIKEESKEEETSKIEHEKKSNIESICAEVKGQFHQDVKPHKEKIGSDEGIQDCGEKLDVGEQGDDDLIEEDPEEVVEEDPEEVIEEDPEEVIEEDPEEVVEEDPEEVVEEDPEEVVEEDPEEAIEEDPEEVIEEDPEEIIEEDPEEVIEEDPEEINDEDPEELINEDPEECIEEDPVEPPEETEILEEQHQELAAIANQHKIKQENEIFVRGLDFDATEEDLRKVFEKIGEVVEVRLHKNLSMRKNKGYALVKFANKEHAKKALSDMKNPIIHGKRCTTAPNEDNNTLFLGNICNTWTKEAIKEKLNDYGLEGLENITLVPDVQHDGLSRGFAFLEFSCHADAMIAYKRLQKPDAIFGHAERTAKVAFAEPLREPDPEVMAHVKSVFIDGLPPHWDEDHVREHVKGYGEIVRLVLARNMPTAKRKDFGFVDFSAHEAAVACVDGVNNSELGEQASKTKVRARLSNPLPKAQTVKGSMSGGLQIGRARKGVFPRFGRAFAQGGHPNSGNFNRNRNLYQRRPSQIGIMGLPNDNDFSKTCPIIHQRQLGLRGERWGPLRGGHYADGQGAEISGPSTPYLARAWYDIPERGPAIPPRRPFYPEGQFERPLMGRRFDDPSLYGENVHGVKRPFYMIDPYPDHMGPSQLRPRLDYTDPALLHGAHYHDFFGAGSRQYSHDYYGPDYGGGPYSSFYGGDRPYSRGYYYY